MGYFGASQNRSVMSAKIMRAAAYFRALMYLCSAQIDRPYDGRPNVAGNRLWYPGVSISTRRLFA